MVLLAADGSPLAGDAPALLAAVLDLTADAVAAFLSADPVTPPPEDSLIALQGELVAAKMELERTRRELEEEKAAAAAAREREGAERERLTRAWEEAMRGALTQKEGQHSAEMAPLQELQRRLTSEAAVASEVAAALDGARAEAAELREAVAAAQAARDAAELNAARAAEQLSAATASSADAEAQVTAARRGSMVQMQRAAATQQQAEEQLAEATGEIERLYLAAYLVLSSLQNLVSLGLYFVLSLAISVPMTRRWGALPSARLAPFRMLHM